MPLSPDAVAAAYTQYATAVLAYCRQRVPDPHAAEDCASAVWVDLLRQAPTYQERGYQVGALLYRIAHSRCADYWRAQQRRSTVPLDATLVAPALDVDGVIDALALLDELAQNRPDYAAILLAKAAGDEDREIAGRLGISPGAVKAIAHRARAAALKLRRPYV